MQDDELLAKYPPDDKQRFGAVNDGRVNDQPYRQALARELDDGALATQRIFALQW